MKLCVSLPAQDVAALDAYVERSGLPSRSAGVQQAIRMLAHPTLEDDYAHAWEEWSASDEAGSWENVAGDGLDRASR